MLKISSIIDCMSSMFLILGCPTNNCYFQNDIIGIVDDIDPILYDYVEVHCTQRINLKYLIGTAESFTFLFHVKT